MYVHFKIPPQNTNPIIRISREGTHTYICMVQLVHIFH